MSQACFEPSEDIQQLEAEAVWIELQAKEAKARLAAARQRSASIANTTEFLPSQKDFQLSSSPSSVALQAGQPRSIPCYGGLMVHTGSQPFMPQYQQTPAHRVAHPMKRTKTTHPQSHHPMSSPAADMLRSKSSSAAANPFTGVGRIKPISTPQAQPSSMDMMDKFVNESEQQQPANNYVLAHSMGNTTSTQPRKPELGTVMEVGGILEDPGMWLSRQGLDVPTTSSQLAAHPAVAPFYGQPSSTSDAFQSLQPPGLPTSQCGSLTSGPTIETNMTRSNSTANQSVSGQMQMMRLNSQSSTNDGLTSHECGGFGLPWQQLSPGNKRSAPDDDLLQVGSGSNLGDVSSAPTVSFFGRYSSKMGRSISMDSRRSMSSAQPSPQSSGAIDRRSAMFAVPMQRNETSESQMSAQSLSSSALAVPAEQSEPMMPSISASSAKSAQFQRVRAKDSLQRQIAAGGSQLLAPKPKDDPNQPEKDPAPSTKAGKDGKVAVTKTKYERPKHPKVICTLCKDYPEGFRGEHELRRHTEAKHSVVVKKYVCIDPATRGIKSDVQPITTLEKCKHCRGRKLYGAYYNAAAHLRRAHFCKKPSRAKGAAKNGNRNDGEAAEKRGAKSGGGWPPMLELRKWMEETSVSISEQDALDSATAPDDEEMQNVEMDSFDDSSLNAFSNLPAGHLDNTAVYGVGRNPHVENAQVYTNLQELYAGSPTTQLDTMGMMPSTGSANFDFNSPFSPSFHQSAAMDPNYHSPNVSSSTATLMATNYNNFVDTQYSQGPSQATTMTMSQRSQEMLGDFGFDMVFPDGSGDSC